MDKHKWQEYHEIPNDLHKIVSNVYEYVIMSYLLQLSNLKSIHPSIETLRLGLMSRRIAADSIKSLESKGYISHRSAIPSPLANEYTIHFDVIERAFIRLMSGEELTARAKRELSEKQKDSFATRRVMEKPELQKKVSNMINFNQKNKTGNYSITDSQQGDTND